MDKLIYHKYLSFVLLQCLVYGLGNPLTKFAYETISPLWLLTARFLLAGLLFLLVFGKTVLAQLKKFKMSLWLPAGLSTAVCYILGNLSLNLTSATNMGFLCSLQVVFTPILAWLLYRQGYRRAYIIIQVMVVAGLYLLCSNGGRFTFNLGDAAALAAAVAGAGALVFGAKAVKEMDPIAVSAAQCLVTAVISIPLALIFDDIAVLGQADFRAWLVVLYLALTCSCLAYVLQNRALTFLPASAVSLLQCLVPILTSVFSWWMLGERLYLPGLLGAAIIVCSIIAQNILMHKPQQEEVA